MGLIRSSICDAISSQLEDLIQEVENFRYIAQSQIDTVTNSLIELRDAAAFSTIEEIQQAFFDVQNALQFIIPPVDMFDEIIAIIESCSFLRADSFFANPAILASFILDQLKNRCMEMLFDVSDLPEILLSRFLADIGNLLPSMGVDVAIVRARLLIECLTNVCGINSTSSLYRLVSVVHSTHVTYTGIFNPTALMESVEIEPTVIGHVNSSVAIVNNIYTSVENNCNLAIDSFKERFPT